MGAASGRFVWYDVMTTDLPGAKAFYADLVGWTTTPWSGGGYEMWTAGNTQVGGLMALPEDALKAGARPHWLGYIDVDSADATVKRAQQLGGKVLHPPTDIPSVGRFAILNDPQGAMFALIQSLTEMPPPDREGPGRFSWAELNTTDWKGAWTFYSELFGWKPTQSMNMGPELGEYFMFGMDSQQSMGGMSNAAGMMKAPAHWLHYINVKNTDEAAKRLVQKGGKVLNGPMDVPGGDRIAQCLDPQGGMFAIYSQGTGR
jgi:hypothetical protein